MTAAMDSQRKPTELALLELDAIECPYRLSDEDFYAEAGGSRRVGGFPFDDREDER